MKYKKLDGIKDNNKRLEAKIDNLYYEGTTNAAHMFSYSWFIISIIAAPLIIIMSFVSKTNLSNILYYPIGMMLIFSVATVITEIQKHYKIKRRYFKK